MPTLPARTGAHAVLNKGQSLKITLTHGPQVIDTWAFALTRTSTKNPNTISNSHSSPPYTYLSTTHTRSHLYRLRLSTGDTLVSNTRQPMLTLLQDTSPGVHDMLFAACDRGRYEQLGVKGYHASCSDNLRDEFEKIAGTEGLDLGLGSGGEARSGLLSGACGCGHGSEANCCLAMPDPLNLFMNVPVAEWRGGQGGGLGIEAPTCRKGDFVVLRAEVDVVVVMSACPMDLNQANGGQCRDVEYEVLV